MDNDSTTDDTNSAADKTDDFDLSGEDNAGNDSQDSTDDSQTGDKADDLTSDDDSTDKGTKGDKTAEAKTPAFDKDLDEWAEKKGYEKPENDRERKLFQELRNNEREFTRNRQTKKTADDLNKTIKDAAPKADADAIVDPLEKDVASLRSELNQERTTRLQSEYFSQNGVTADEVEVMGEILKEKAARGDMSAFNYLSDARNLGDLHDLVKIRMQKTETSDVAEKAKQEERERIAKLSKSTSTSRSAKSTVPGNKTDELTELWSSDD